MLLLQINFVSSHYSQSRLYYQVCFAESQSVTRERERKILCRWKNDLFSLTDLLFPAGTVCQQGAPEKHKVMANLMPLCVTPLHKNSVNTLMMLSCYCHHVDAQEEKLWCRVGLRSAFCSEVSTENMCSMWSLYMQWMQETTTSSLQWSPIVSCLRDRSSHWLLHYVDQRLCEDLISDFEIASLVFASSQSTFYNENQKITSKCCFSVSVVRLD